MCLNIFTNVYAQTADELKSRVWDLAQEENYKEAISVAGNLLILCRKNDDQRELATCLVNTAQLYVITNNKEMAVPLLSEAITVLEKVDDHTYSVRCLREIGQTYNKMENYKEAASTYRKAIFLKESILGKNNPKVNPDYIRNVEHREYADLLLELAEVYQSQKDPAMAAAIRVQLEPVLLKEFGKDHPMYFKNLLRLHGLYVDLKDEAATERVMAMLNSSLKVEGGSHRDENDESNDLDNTSRIEDLCQQGRLCEAQEVAREAMETRKLHIESDPVGYAASLVNLAGVHVMLGLYEKAEPLYIKANYLLSKQGDPLLANALNGLASLYHGIGMNDESLKLLTRAKVVIAKSTGNESSEYALCMNNIAMLLEDEGRYDLAISYLVQALKILAKNHGKSDPYYAIGTSNLGHCNQNAGDFKSAEECYRDAMAILEENLGKDHPDYASILDNLGSLYYAMGAYEKAEQLFLQANVTVREVYGESHPSYIENLRCQAYSQFLIGNLKEALACAFDEESRSRDLWGRLRSFTSERQREAAIQTVGNLDLPGTLGSGPLAAESLLWRKGALLESLVVERRLAQAAGADKELAAQLEKAENLKGILRQALMEGNKAKLSDAQIAKHQAELEALQKAMARKVGGLGEARRSLECSVEQVQAAFPTGAVLVDFSRYGHALGKGKREDRYAAVLITPNVDPVFVPLGKATDIETALARHRKLAGSSPAADETAARNTELEVACKELHKLVGASIEAALPPGTTELILCPDGQLHFLAFSALMDKDGKLWAEKFTLRNISTARDLLKLSRSRAASADKTAVLVGNPDFRDSTPLALVAEAEDARDSEERERLAFNLTRGGQNDELRGLNFKQLRGTAIEVAGLKTRFERQGWKTQVFTGSGASEPTLVAAVNSPDILHLATHGYFVDELDLGQKKTRERQSMNGGLGGDDLRLRGAARDPMLRSGLALSGAQSTRSLWENGKVPPLDKDGILTAAEVASLRLQGTRLVTLSACETGLGESKSGEGVLGLQRAIALAGAENLLMTLWSISDADTIAFMTAFYDRVLAGEHPARALPAVQREALVRLRAEHGLWHAINRAAPFVIVSNTAVPAILKK